MKKKLFTTLRETDNLGESEGEEGWEKYNILIRIIILKIYIKELIRFYKKKYKYLRSFV